MHVLIALLACSGAPDKPDPTPEPGPEPVEAPEPDSRAGMHVEPLSINWDDEADMLSVEARLVGEGVEEREDPVHVGVTAVTQGGKEVDLLVHTLFPAAMGESLLFSTGLEEDPQHVLIGAWNTRVEPCESDRPGCKEFGFVLDDSIASWPAKLYTEGMRQRFIPDDFRIQVKGDADPVEARANEYAEPFGSTVQIEPYAGERAEKGVWVKRSDDLGIAHAVASELDLPYAEAEGELPADMVVVR